MIPILDDPKAYTRYDPQGMLDHIHNLPDQCERAWRMAQGFSLPADYAHVNKIIILGMGGSAIGGDLAGSLAAGECRAPIVVSRSYSLPAFADESTLVIASSYSGNTEETLSAFGMALQTRAKKLAVTTGGKLKEVAEKAGVPVFQFDFRAQPRAALGFSLFPLICFLQKLGFLADKSADVAEAIQIMKSLDRELTGTALQRDNPAKQLAAWLYGGLPVIYGASITGEVAHRWKTQLNENSKTWAFHEVFPELNHNAVVGYDFPKELGDKIRVVLLSAPDLPPRILIRYEVTCRLLQQAGISYKAIESRGKSPLAQLMSLVLYGDYTTGYLAILYGVDPSPVKAIDYLKAQLAKQ